MAVSSQTPILNTRAIRPDEGHRRADLDRFLAGNDADDADDDDQPQLATNIHSTDML